MSKSDSEAKQLSEPEAGRSDHHFDSSVQKQNPKKSGWFGKLVLLIVLGGAGYGGYVYWEQQQKAKQAQAASAAQPAPPTPVVTAAVKVADFPVYLTGLGTAQASQSVTLRVRVDGQITKIGFEEGALVKEGDLIAQIDQRAYQAQLEQVSAQKARDEALLANAKNDLERFSSLLKNDYASKQSVDTQKSLVAQYTAAVRSDEASISLQQTNLSFTTITSPITGIAGVRLIDVGNIVRATDANGIVVITQIEPISAIFTVPQDALDNIRNAMKQGDVKILASARTDTAPRAEGKLLVVDNQIDQATGSLHLKASFENKEHVLWPGQFLNFKVLLRVRKDALTIPSTAVQRGAQGLFVYVVKDDTTVETRPIGVAESANGVTVVEKGLKAGDIIVSDGQYKLKPGVKVKSQNDQTAAVEQKSPEIK